MKVASGRRSARIGLVLTGALLAGLWCVAGAADAPAAKGDAAAPPPSDVPNTSWIDTIRRPVSWFTWGLDLRLRQEYLDNPFLIEKDPPGHQWDFGRYRTRVWTTISPLPELDVNARLAWESRYWYVPNSKPSGYDQQDVFWDTLNFRLHFGEKSSVPVSVTVGRQDIILGDGWLVLEGTPLDGSTSIYFDAARFSFNFKQAKTKVDAIFVQQEAHDDGFLKPFHDQERPQIEQNERGAMLYVSNTSLARTVIEPYFLYKHDERVLVNGDSGDVYTLGSRVVHDLDDHWRVRCEGAYQWGQRRNAALFPTSNGELSAWGTTDRLTYFFKDAWKQQLYVGYEYLSGDDAKTKTNEQFDPLWGRWPQWTELYIYTVAVDTRIAEISNLHRVNLGWSAEPVKNLGLTVNYHALFADRAQRVGRAGFNPDGHFRGHLVTAIARYKFNDFMSGHIMGEYFIPGDYWRDNPNGGPFLSRHDPAAYLRAELVLGF